MALTLKERLALKASQVTGNDPLAGVNSPVIAGESTSELVEAVKVEEKAEERKNAIVEQAINEAKQRSDNNVYAEAEQTVADIIPRIRALEELSEDSLDEEMDYLKNALMANPAAVSLMLPEDVGSLVKALRRLTGEVIVASIAGKGTKKPKQKMLTTEELLAVADEL